MTQSFIDPGTGLKLGSGSGLRGSRDSNPEDRHGTPSPAPERGYSAQEIDRRCDQLIARERERLGVADTLVIRHVEPRPELGRRRRKAPPSYRLRTKNGLI